MWVFSSNALGKQTPRRGKKTKNTLKHVRIPNPDCCSFYMSMSFEQINAFIREIMTGAPSLLWVSSNLASPPSVPSGPFSDQLMITRPCTPLCAYSHCQRDIRVHSFIYYSLLTIQETRPFLFTMHHGTLSAPNRLQPPSLLQLCARRVARRLFIFCFLMTSILPTGSRSSVSFLLINSQV